MPFVSRDKNQKITAVFRQKQENATEELSSSNPELIRFLFSESEDSSAEHHLMMMELSELRVTDLGMIRVVEDLINVLCDKGILSITDLPEPAVRRLKSRQAIRLRLETIGRVLGEHYNPKKDGN